MEDDLYEQHRIKIQAKLRTTNGRGHTRPSRNRASVKPEVTLADKTTTDEIYIYKKLKKKRKKKGQLDKDRDSDWYWEVRVPYRVDYLVNGKRRKYYTMNRLVDMSCPDTIPEDLIKQRDKWLKLPEVRVIMDKKTSDPLGYKHQMKDDIIASAYDMEENEDYGKSLVNFRNNF
tara:strand:+ start:650 stop:1171 length:522 start_codon:yes stop_codon:yes gene_type:complete